MGEAAKNLVHRPDIYSYHDFREFLRDWFAYLKTSDKSFSLRQMLKRAGVARSLLSMILNNNQTFTDKTFNKIAMHIQLSGTELEFLNTLIALSDSETQEAKERAFESLKSFSQYKRANTKEVQAYKYLNHWFYPAIRELAQLENFKPDPWWIKDRLRMKISITEIRDALYFLLNNGFLEYDVNGKIKSPDKPINCEAGIFRLSIASYHRQMLELAGEAFHNSSRGERSMSGHTIAINPEEIEEVRAIMEDASSKIKELSARKRKAGRVYQISLVAFPLSENEEGKSSKASEDAKASEVNEGGEDV